MLFDTDATTASILAFSGELTSSVNPARISPTLWTNAYFRAAIQAVELSLL